MPKFLDVNHEKEFKFWKSSHKLGMRVKIQDFEDCFEGNIEDYQPSIVFRDPKSYDKRVEAIKKKFSDTTGIDPSEMEIVSMNISSKKYNIAWIEFSDPDVVKFLFDQASKVQSSELHIFPVLPDEVAERRVAIEKMLMEMKRLDPTLRFQLRNGKTDIEIYLKHYMKEVYEPYKLTPVEFLDPNGDFPKYKSANKYNNIPKHWK